ncbi:MAG: HEPN domain-containing protein [Spirochaetota bacterium]
MSEEILELADKAKRSLNAAKLLHENGDYDFAVSRAYYAMFYIASAILLKKNLAYSKHSAVISAIHQHFVKTGQLDRKYHKAFAKAFERRQIGDYTFSRKISEEESEKIISDTEEFIKKLEELLNEV